MCLLSTADKKAATLNHLLLFEVALSHSDQDLSPINRELIKVKTQRLVGIEILSSYK